MLLRQIFFISMIVLCDYYRIIKKFGVTTYKLFNKVSISLIEGCDFLKLEVIIYKYE